MGGPTVRILITGDAGFVGSHLRRALDTPDNDITGCDIKNGQDCRDLFRHDDTRYDLALHCAAIVGGRATIEGQPMQVATDLAIDSDYMQFLLRSRPGRAVYFSSSAAYPVRWQTAEHDGLLSEEDIDLDNLDQPDNTYGLAKLVGEVQARLVQAEGVGLTVVRPFSGYGPDQDLTYPFPSFVHRAVTKADPFEVWGDGRQVRDWIHIDDVVGAVLELVARRVDGPVNLCTGRAVSMDDLAAMCMEAAGHRAPLVHHVNAPVGVSWRVGDPAGMLRWFTPRWSLEAGVADAVDRARAVA